MDVIWSALATAGLAVLSVTLWTARVAVTAAGRRLAGAAIAALEAITLVYAFARIGEHLDTPVGIVAYGLGVAAGTMLGVRLEERLSTGQSWVQIMIKGDGMSLAQALTGRRWPVTMLAGSGPEGAVAELAIAVDDSWLPMLQRDLSELAPEAFWTVQRVRSAYAHPLGGNLRQVHDRAWAPSSGPSSAASRRRTRTFMAGPRMGWAFRKAA